MIKGFRHQFRSSGADVICESEIWFCMFTDRTTDVYGLENVRSDIQYISIEVTAK